MLERRIKTRGSGVKGRSMIYLLLLFIIFFFLPKFSGSLVCFPRITKIGPSLKLCLTLLNTSCCFVSSYIVSVFIRLSIQSQRYNILREERSYRYSNSGLSDL